VNIKENPIVKKILHYFIKVAVGFLAISIFLVILFRFVPIPGTFLMLTRYFEDRSTNEKPYLLQKEWVSIDDISENLVLAVVCSEDQRFEEHVGFDIDAIEKAINANKKLKKKGKPIHGASTISQQTAKNVFLWQGRNFIRKGFEVYFTLLIETFWSKKRIMEVYLNVIEMGDGIFGAEAASNIYFGKHAKDISPREAALIAAILPNPREWSAISPTAFIRKKQAWIMRQMSYWTDGIDLDGDSSEAPEDKK
jgi:monofunctional biosynthetic peptidoglycan transglycosylase